MKKTLIVLVAVCLCGFSASAEPGGKHGPGKERILTQDERTQLREAHDAVRDNQEVVAAREAFADARNRFQKTMREALLDADPALEPVLDKIEAAKSDRKRNRPGIEE